MTIKKIGNALYIDGDDAVQDAVFYSNLLQNPEVGITARQMKAILDGKSVSIKYTPPTPKHLTVKGGCFLMTEFNEIN